MAVPTLLTDTHARLFLGLSLPDKAKANLQESLRHFPNYIEKIIPPETWHLTLLFLGEVEHPQQYWSRLTKALPQTFIPTVSLMHVGRGIVRDQLWAYAHPSPGLQNLRQQLWDRLRSMRFPIPEKQQQEFVPHVRLATLYPMARGLGMADHAVATTFSVSAVHVYHSAPGNNGPHYTITGDVPL